MIYISANSCALFAYFFALKVMDKCKLAKAIGWRIKQARNALGMIQKDFCVHIGMPLPSLKDYEIGKRIPGGEAITAFMSAGISADWLLSGEGPMLREVASEDADSSQSPAKLVDTRLLGDIALWFEIAQKAQVDKDETAAWILARHAFPDLAEEDERPSKEKFDAFITSCAQRLQITNLIWVTYNNVVGVVGEKERDQAITMYAISGTMILNNAQSAENLRNHVEKLEEKVRKGVATTDEEQWFFAVTSPPDKTAPNKTEN